MRHLSPADEQVIAGGTSSGDPDAREEIESPVAKRPCRKLEVLVLDDNISKGEVKIVAVNIFCIPISPLQYKTQCPSSPKLSHCHV